MTEPTQDLDEGADPRMAAIELGRAIADAAAAALEDIRGATHWRDERERAERFHREGVPLGDVTEVDEEEPTPTGSFAWASSDFDWLGMYQDSGDSGEEAREALLGQIGTQLEFIGTNLDVANRLKIVELRAMLAGSSLGASAAQAVRRDVDRIEQYIGTNDERFRGSRSHE